MISTNKCNYINLEKLLLNSDKFTEKEKNELKNLIDNDKVCWEIWNRVRWDKAINSKGVIELKEYLGKDFIPYFDSSWALAKEWASVPRNTKKKIEEFYEKTKYFIYNSTIFFESGNRINLKKSFKQIAEKYKVQSVLDFGCGVGNDGLMMLDEGYDVIFADINVSAIEFLKWRLEKRKTKRNRYKVINISNSDLKVESDMFWSVDVIEHMKDPSEIFNWISSKTRVVAYFTDADDEAGGRHPFHFKIDNIKLHTEFQKRGYKNVRHNLLNLWIKD